MNSLDYDPVNNIIRSASDDYSVIEISGYPEFKAYYKKSFEEEKTPFNPVLSVRSGTLLCTPLMLSPVRPIGCYLIERNQESVSQYSIPFCSRTGILDLFTDVTFFDKIPCVVKNIVEKFGNSNWVLLRYCLKYPYFMELAESNPALALIVANMDIFTGKKMSSELDSDELLKMKQVKILGLAGFPPQEKIRKSMQRISPEGISVYGLLSLRKFYSTEKEDKRKTKLLSHVPNFNEEIFYVINNSSLLDVVKDSFLIELSRISEKEYRRNILKSLNKTHNLYRLLLQKLPQVRDSEHIKILYKNILKKFNLKSRGEIINTNFKKSPLPDAHFIKYLATPADMIIWGGYMRNCLKSHIRTAFSGNSYYYKIKLGNETATLQLTQNGSRCNLASIKGRFNRDCSANLYDAVRYWFECRGKINP